MSADIDDRDYDEEGNEPIVEDVRTCENCGDELFANEGHGPEEFALGLCNGCAWELMSDRWTEIGYRFARENGDRNCDHGWGFTLLDRCRSCGAIVPEERRPQPKAPPIPTEDVALPILSDLFGISPYQGEA